MQSGYMGQASLLVMANGLKSSNLQESWVAVLLTGVVSKHQPGSFFKCLGKLSISWIPRFPDVTPL